VHATRPSRTAAEAWRLAAVALIAAIACSAAPASRADAAPSSQRLVIPVEALGRLGLKPGAVRRSSAVAALASGLGGGQRRRIASAPVEVAGAGGSGRALLSAAFELRSASVARTLLSQWRRSAHAARAPVGEGGGRLVRGSTVTIAWREGSVIGLVTLRGRKADRTLALQLAALGDLRLRAGPARTAWQRLGEQVGPGGEVSPSTALQRLALADGPLPGVRLPEGRRPRLPSATGAELAVMRYLPRLHGALLAAVKARLGIRTGSGSARAAADSTFHESMELDLMAHADVLAFENSVRLGQALPSNIIVGTSEEPLGADADAAGVGPDGEVLGPGAPICRIRVNPVVASGPFPHLEEVVAHQVFMCFELKDFSSAVAAGEWVTEGLAEWAAESLWPDVSLAGKTSEGLTSPLAEYVQTPETSLFSRSFDGVGYWGHAQDVAGGFLWQKVQEILTSIRPDDAVQSAGGEEEPFLSTWASSVLNLGLGSDPEFSGGFTSAWNMDSPAQVDLRPPAYTIGPGDPILAVPEMTTAQYRLLRVPGEPIVSLKMFDGTARLDSTFEYIDSFPEGLTPTYFCTSSSCDCPPGQEGTPPQTRPLSGLGPLAISGGLRSASEGEVQYISLDKYCHVPKHGPAGGGLLPSHHCAGLLPGFGDVPGSTQEPFETYSVLPGAIDHAHCSGEAKGSPQSIVHVEGFDIARFPTVAAAEADLISLEDTWPSPGNLEWSVGTPGSFHRLENIGDGAIFGEEPTPDGTACTSVADVRTHNIVFGLGLISFQNFEGCGEPATSLLEPVVHKLGG
jgi:hypothetical protein